MWAATVLLLAGFARASPTYPYPDPLNPSDTTQSDKILFVSTLQYSATDVANADELCMDDPASLDLCYADSVFALKSNAVNFGPQPFPNPTAPTPDVYEYETMTGNSWFPLDLTLGTYYWVSNSSRTKVLLADNQPWANVVNGVALSTGVDINATVRYWTGASAWSGTQDGDLVPMTCSDGNSAWANNDYDNFPGQSADLQGAYTGVGVLSTDNAFLYNGGLARCNERHNLLCACRSKAPMVEDIVFDQQGLLQVFFDLPTNGMQLGQFNCSQVFEFYSQAAPVPMELGTTCKFSTARKLTVSLPRNTAILPNTHQMLFSSTMIASQDGTVPAKLPNANQDIHIDNSQSTLDILGPLLSMPAKHALCNPELVIQVDTLSNIDRRRPISSAVITMAPFCFDSFGAGHNSFNAQQCTRSLTPSELESNRYVINTTDAQAGSTYTFTVTYVNWMYENTTFYDLSSFISVTAPGTNLPTQSNKVQMDGSSDFPDVTFAPYDSYQFVSTSPIYIAPDVSFSTGGCSAFPSTRIKWTLYEFFDQPQKSVDVLTVTTSQYKLVLERNALPGGRELAGRDPNYYHCQRFDCTHVYGVKMEFVSIANDQVLFTAVTLLHVSSPAPLLQIQTTVLPTTNAIIVDASQACDSYVATCTPTPNMPVDGPMECYVFSYSRFAGGQYSPCDLQMDYVDPDVQFSPVTGLTETFPPLLPNFYRFCARFSADYFYDDFSAMRSGCIINTWTDCLPVSCVNVQIKPLATPPANQECTPSSISVQEQSRVSLSANGNVNLIANVAVGTTRLMDGVLWEINNEYDEFLPVQQVWPNLMNPTRPSLSIPSHLLVQGSSYEFRISHAAPGCLQPATHTVQFSVNDNPFGGTCIVSPIPAAGVSFSTDFTLHTTGWIDADLPLLYAFEFKTPADANPQTLRSFAMSNTLTTKLVSNHVLGNVAYVVVKDTFGAMSQRTVCGEIELTPVDFATLPTIATLVGSALEGSFDEQLRLVVNLATLAASNATQWRNEVLLASLQIVNRTRSLTQVDSGDMMRQVDQQTNALLAGLRLDEDGALLNEDQLESTAQLVNALLFDAQQHASDNVPDSFGANVVDVLSQLAKSLEKKLSVGGGVQRRMLLRGRALATPSCAQSQNCRTVDQIRLALHETIHALSVNLVPGQPAIEFQGSDVHVIAKRESRTLVGGFDFNLGNSRISLPSTGLLTGSFYGVAAAPPDIVDIAVVRIFFNLPELAAPGGKALSLPDDAPIDISTEKFANYSIGETTSIYFISSQDSTTLIDPYNLTEPILVTMPTQQQDSEMLACGAWDAHLATWSDAGCTVRQVTGNQLTCACTHASDYAVWTAFLRNVGGGEMGIVQPIAIAVIAVLYPLILVSYLVVVYWTVRKDKDDAHEVHRGALILLSRNTIGLRLKQRKFFQLLRENAANPKPLVIDVAKAQRLQKEKEAQLAALQQTKDGVFTRWFNALKFDHSLFGLFNRFDPYYTRVQRATVVLCILVGNLFVTALLFDLKVDADDISVGFMIGVVVASALIIAIPVKFLVRFLFRSTEAEIGSTMDRVIHIYRVAYVHTDLLPVYTTRAEQADIQMLLAFQRFFIAKNDLKRLEAIQHRPSSSHKWRQWFAKIGGNDKSSSQLQVAALSSLSQDKSMLKSRLNVTLDTEQEYEVALDNAKSNIAQAKEVLRKCCEVCHEEWSQVPRSNPRVELLRRQESTLMRFASLVYDEVDDGMVRERAKLFNARFQYVVWTLVFCYVVGTLAFCARWVLAYTSDRGDDSLTEDANEVIGNWLLVSFVGVILTFLLTEPLFELIRFALVPACMVRFGAPIHFAKQGAVVVVPHDGNFSTKVEHHDDGVKKEEAKNRAVSLIFQQETAQIKTSPTNSVGDGGEDIIKAEKRDKFAQEQAKKKQGESRANYFGAAAFDFVAEAIENVI